MVPVEHTGDTVEAETVQMVFLHPELAVGEEEILGLVLSVIETSRAPGRMSALRAPVEVEVLLSVEAAEPLGLIVHAMRMNYVHHHGNAPGMGVVHEMLELLRGTEAGGQCVEVGDLIAE